MITSARVQAAEGSHWYGRDGSPQYEIKGKNGKMRKTTIADARKHSWLPSPTNILGVLAKPGLEAWKTEQACLAVLTAPHKDGEPLDVFVQRVLGEEREHEQEASAAADLGSRVHAAIAARLMDDVPLPQDDTAKITRAAVEWYMTEFSCSPAWVELVVVGNGYAGKADLGVVKDDQLYIIDWKTAKTLPRELGWPEHGLQLAAYAGAMKGNDYPFCVTLNAYLSTTEPGKIHVAKWPGWDANYKAFMSCFALWQHLKDYRPNETVEDKLTEAGL